MKHDLQLATEEQKASIRMSYRTKIENLWNSLDMNSMSPTEVRRVFRKERPDETHGKYWPYKVWREEVRRRLGLPNGPKAKRTVNQAVVMPSMREWAKRHGLILSDERPTDPGAEAGTLLAAAGESLPVQEAAQVAGSCTGPCADADEQPQAPDIH